MEMQPERPIYHRNGGMASFGADDLIDIARSVRQLFTDLGVQIRPSSRIARQIADTEAFGHMLADPYAKTAFSANADIALTEMKQLGVIAKFFRGAHEDEEVRSLLQSLVKDSSSPFVGDETPGRDAQFELYCAAVCRRALYMIARDEPDFRVTPLVGLAGVLGEVGLAVKRVKKEPKLAKRLREGRRQLEASKSGFIVMDTSMLFNRPQAGLSVPPDARGIDMVARHVDEYLGPRMRSLAHCVNSPAVLGVICYASVNTAYALPTGGFIPGCVERWLCFPLHVRFMDHSIDFGNRLAAH